MSDPQESIRELFGDSPLNPESGKLLHNQYKIVEKLGQGGMGAVYKATDCINQRNVAIKRIALKTNNPINSAMIERFRREYYFLRKIHHPNLVKAYDFFEEMETLFLVMEFVEGTSLYRLIKNQSRSLTLQQQLDLARQICLAVAVLNDSQILHRDVKPQNIIISNDRKHLKLVDLGICKSLDEETSSLTEHGFVLGTPSYLSPEQVRGSISERSDIFSLGLTLYQFFLWLPHSPFHAEHKMVIMQNIIEMQLPPLMRQLPENLTKLERTVYRNISEILQQALAKNPQRRLAYARELADELGLLLELYIGKQSEVPVIAEMAKTVEQVFSQVSVSEPDKETISIQKKVKDFILYRKVWENEGFELYVGWDLERKCGVLIKKIAQAIPSLQRNIFQEQLIKEYYCFAGLEHPNIAKALDLLEIEDEIFVIYSPFRGITLKEAIQQFPDSIELDIVLYLIVQISQAIDYLHNQGIIIGNLQPENIFLDVARRQILLTNFIHSIEIKKEKIDYNKSFDLPNYQSLNLSYLSPEQLQQQITFKSDIFSFGVLIYQFLTWQPNSPFAAHDPKITVNKILSLPIPLLNENIPQDYFQNYHSIYQKLQAVLDHILQKNFLQRFSSNTLLKELQQILELFEKNHSCLNKKLKEKEVSQEFDEAVAKAARALEDAGKAAQAIQGNEKKEIKSPILGKTQKISKNDLSQGNSISLSDGQRQPSLNEKQLKLARQSTNITKNPEEMISVTPPQDSQKKIADNSGTSLLELEEKELPITGEVVIPQEDTSQLRHKSHFTWSPDLFRWKHWKSCFLVILDIFSAIIFTLVVFYINIYFSRLPLPYLSDLGPKGLNYHYLVIILIFSTSISIALFKHRNIIWGLIGGLEPINFLFILLFLPNYSLSSILKEKQEGHLSWKYWNVIKICISVLGFLLISRFQFYFNASPDSSIIIFLSISILFSFYLKIGFLSILGSLFTSLLSSPFALFRIPAIWLLGYSGSDYKLRYALSDLGLSLKHPSSLIRWFSLRTVSKILFYDAVEQQQDSTRFRRWKRGRQTLLEYSLEGLNDKKWYVRAQALKALEKISHPDFDIEPYLQKFLNDPIWIVRGIAAEVINTRIRLQKYLIESSK